MPLALPEMRFQGSPVSTKSRGLNFKGVLFFQLPLSPTLGQLQAVILF